MGPRVGIIGLGVIGRPIAERVAAAGFPLAVYDVRPEPLAALVWAGAKGCGSAAEVAVNLIALPQGLALGAAATVEPAPMRRILAAGLAGSTALEVWEQYGQPLEEDARSRGAGRNSAPNLRKDLHFALTLNQQLGFGSISARRPPS